jgi:ferredoxin-NADP reductase
MLFFAAVMLTEPLGLPQTARMQYIYAALIGIISPLYYHMGPFSCSPEFALVVGNIFTFALSRPSRLTLSFEKRIEVGKNTFEYYFKSSYPLSFIAGQYLEWTLPHRSPDSRGIRRYFTISSAPGAEHVTFSVKHMNPQSTWKQTLETLTQGSTLFATQLAGDFSLKSETEQSVWIAGGIGITPFMSMMRAATQNKRKLNATLLYCSRSQADIAFLDEVTAAAGVGIASVHFLSEAAQSGATFTSEVGFITAESLAKHVPFWKEATFYISGPPPLVASYENLLHGLGVSKSKVIVDYFPGLA